MQMASAEDELVSCQRVLSGPSHLWVLFRPAVGHGYLVFFPVERGEIRTREVVVTAKPGFIIDRHTGGE